GGGSRLARDQAGDSECRHRAGGDNERQDAPVPRARTHGRGVHIGGVGADLHVYFLEITMDLLQNPEFGARLVTLMAASVLVLQIAMFRQRSLVVSIR